MKLFLEGPRGMGKTTTILKEIQKSSCKAVGFVSVRLLNDGGETVGFYLAHANTLKATTLHYQDPSINPLRIFLSGLQGSRKLNLSAFENIEEFLMGYEEADLIVMDELGGVELKVPSFCRAVYAILKSDYNCIGTIKSQVNYQKMKERMGMALEDEDALALRNLIINSKDSSITALTDETRPEVEAKVQNYLKLCGANK